MKTATLAALVIAALAAASAPIKAAYYSNKNGIEQIREKLAAQPTQKEIYAAFE